MQGIFVLLAFNIKRRIKDAFVIGYNIVYPIIMILVLGYLSQNYFKGDADFNSYKYYSIVVIPFCILCGLLNTAFIAREEKTFKTAYRFLTAPIGRKAIVLGKIISSTIVLWGCTLVALLIVRITLGINLFRFENILLYFFENFMISSMGVFFGIAFKKFNLLKGILNLPLTIFALLGGVFFPVGFMGKITNISPLTWFNRALIDNLFGDSTIIIRSLFILSFISVTFIILSVKNFSKEVLL